MDPLTIKWLIENTQNQYNLVCNVLMEVCGCNDNEKLNDIAILCCEFTAQCPSLSSEWMGAFAALCNAPVDYGYQVCTFIFVYHKKSHFRVNISEEIRDLTAKDIGQKLGPLHSAATEGVMHLFDQNW